MKRRLWGPATMTCSIGVVALFACGIGIRRDLSSFRAGQVGFDDMCGLQKYFDAIECRRGTPPRIVFSVDVGLEGGRPIGGKALWSFETPFQKKHALRVLRANWKRLPDELGRTRIIQLQVYWANRAGIERVVSDEDAELQLLGRTYSLPYHHCLSELLYGAPLYRQRRRALGLPPLVVPAAPSAATGSEPADAAAELDSGSDRDGGIPANADSGPPPLSTGSTAPNPNTSPRPRSNRNP